MELFILIVCLAIFAELNFIVAKKYKPLKSSKRKIYVDTSVLIDGRITSLAKTGFLDGELIILKDVLLELQLLADSKEPLKRTRARVGLDAVTELERVSDINTVVVEEKTGLKKVDEVLLKVAKDNGGEILTMDYNLLKVAEAEKIKTLNINELSLAIRTEFSIGERMIIRITEKGSNPKQGVGHTPDGVMVVVDNASRYVGEELEVEFARFHQTPAGKMVFAKIADEEKRIKQEQERIEMAQLQREHDKQEHEKKAQEEQKLWEELAEEKMRQEKLAKEKLKQEKLEQQKQTEANPEKPEADESEEKDTQKKTKAKEEKNRKASSKEKTEKTEKPAGTRAKKK